MFVLEIIPLSRTAPAEALSYRSTKNIAAGTIVEVPLRRKVVPGLVIGSVPALEAKAELKRASFSLSRTGTKELGKLPRVILEAAKAVATYHATTLGAVLSALVVPVALEDDSNEDMLMPARLSRGDAYEEKRVEGPLEYRRETYEKIIKKDGVTLLVVPTQAEVDEWSEFFKSWKPVVISGRLSLKKRQEQMVRACGAHPSSSLVITTPSFSWLPIPRLTTIIIERISAGGYSLPKRPYLDVRHALTELARVRNLCIVYGDYPLPLEYRASPEKPLAQASDTKVAILDTRTEKEPLQKKSNGAWKAVPDEVLMKIKKTIDDGGRVAVLAVRKGYAPTVICRDCGTAVTDEHGRTLTFTTSGNQRLFRSVDGTTMEAAHTFCKNCHSWNLMPLGIGVERVEEELRKEFPKTPLVMLDQVATAKTSLKKIHASIQEPGTIIVGTEGMMPWLSIETPVELGVIASADSLLALPFWRSRERFIRIALMMAERSLKMIVATRRPEDAALSAIDSPKASSFWKEETNLRKVLNYPPFGTLIVFQVEASVSQLAQARAAINAASAPFIPIELPTRAIASSIVRGVSVLHLPNGTWPDEKLSARLASLSPAIRIHLDSESLW